MNKLIAAMALAALTTTVYAQTPTTPLAANPAPSSAPTLVREPPSNLQMAIDVDRFIGDPAKSITRISRETIMTRTILSAGDPDKPGRAGAVLRYRKEVVLGTMQAGESTPLSTMPEQQVIYVKGGQGRIDDGTQYWDLKDGLVILIPPNRPHRLTNTGTGPLKMIMMSALPRAGVTSVPGILVRDVSKILYIEQGVHWTNLSKSPLTDAGERFLIVYMGPHSIAGPHAHTPETEEGWVKITDGPALMQLGSEIRPWNADVGLLSPNNNQTVHAAINLSDEVQAWFYFQGMGPNSPPPPGPAPAPTNGRPPVNPAIPKSAVDATIPGKPLVVAPNAHR